MTQGIIFAAAGERYVGEAEAAFDRISEVWPGIAATIFKFHPDDRPVQKYRMKAMQASPYELTICMDTDTYLVEPVPELFEVLENFDCALPLADVRHVYPIDAPECFYEFNPGVFAFKQSPRMTNFLIDWERRFDQHYDMLNGVSHPEVGWFHSQPSFTEAMYYSTLRIAPLGQEYNWRGNGYVHRKVKIVHKRPNPQEEAKRINVTANKPRIAFPHDPVRVWR